MKGWCDNANRFEFGRLNRAEIATYTPLGSVRVYDNTHGYEQLLQVTRIVLDGKANSNRYTMYMDDAAIPLNVYTNPLAMRVTFSHCPF